jgi:predicted transcriptional regulator
MQTHDSRGRRYPNRRTPTGKTPHKPTGARLRLLEELSWYPDGLPSDHCKELLRIHGLVDPRSNGQMLTDFFHETITYDVNGKLKKGHYLNHPAWQFPAIGNGWPSRHQHIVQQCGDAAIVLLAKEHRLYPEGFYYTEAHKMHAMMQNIITAEIRIGVGQFSERTFIPSHRVSVLPNAYDLELDGKKYTLKPDQRFIIDYGGKQRLFFLEVHRGTEDTTGMGKKKTVEKMLRLYRAFIGRKDGAISEYQKYFKFPTPIPAFVLIVFSNKGDMETAMKLYAKITEGKGSNFIGFRLDERFKITDGRRDFAMPMMSFDNHNGAWSLAGERPDFYIHEEKGFKAV